MIVPPAVTVSKEGVALFAWTYIWNLLVGDVGSPCALDFVHSAPRSVNGLGTDGVGGALVYEGSLDGATFFPLNVVSLDGWLNNAAMARLENTMGQPNYFRPHCTAGDSSTNYQVTFVLRRTYGQ